MKIVIKLLACAIIGAFFQKTSTVNSWCNSNFNFKTGSTSNILEEVRVTQNIDMPYGAGP